MRNNVVWIGCLTMACFCLAASGGQPAPLGHTDFCPSPDQPVGERGDWTGLFPGARGVALEWDHRTGKNIIWRCPLPAWSNSSPIVVGKKVLVGSEPDELVCIEAEKGTVLWRKSLFIDEHIPAADRPAVRTALREIEDQALAMDVPGAVVAQWVAAVKPLEDPAVAATAKRIEEVLERCRKNGYSPDTAKQDEDAKLFSAESRAILLAHKMLTPNKPFPRKDVLFHAQHGFTMPTPVSDGKYVWCQTGLGAVACLDLDGKVIWNKRTPTCGSPTQSFANCGSPLVIGERLFYTLQGRQVFAVEKATGKEVWSHDAGKDGIWGRGTGGIIPLRLGGKDFIQCPGLPILDAATGACVGKLPFPAGGDARRGHTVSGDSVIYTVDMMIGRARVALDGDKVKTEDVWKANGPPWQCTVVYDGNVYFVAAPHHSEVTCVPFAGGGRIGKNDRMTGDVIGKWEPTWKIPEAMLKPQAEAKKKPRPYAECWQYGAPVVADGHLFVGDDTQGMIVIKLAGAKSTIVSRNFMDLFIRGNPFFQGNRMYVRSFHYLYCIGNGAVRHGGPGGN